MPCYTITTVKTNVGKWNIDRFNRIIKEFPQLNGIQYANGTLITQARNELDHTYLVNTVKRHYAKQTILDASKRFGFRISSQTINKNTIQLKLSR